MKNYLKKLLFLSSLPALFCLNVAAQNAAATSDETQNRVRQLETEVRQMQAEIETLKKLVNQNQAAQNQTVAAQTENKTTQKTAPENKPTETAVTNKTAAQPQTKKDLGVDVGTARVTPYGTIYFNAFGNSGGTNNADVPLFATPTGAGNVSASARQTRLGVRVEGVRVGKANLKAVLEADFFGGFPAVGIGENFGVVRLRLANVRLDWEKTSLTIGQDWMVFAPNNPVSIAAAAIPQMAAAGNPWARLPQIKVERKLNGNFTFQGAILAPQTGDYPTASTFFLQPTSGAASRIPFFQSRIAFADKNFFGTKKSGSIGLSGHYGRSRIFTGAANIKNNADSFGLALDWNVPLAATLTLAGEAFFGRNLGGFQAGVFQGVNPDFAYRTGSGALVAGGVRGIGTRGGWTQLGFTPNVLENRLSFYGSIGLDNPRSQDLISLTRRDFRTRNLAFAFDAIYKFTPQFQIGAEFRRFQTNYFFSGRQNSNHVNLGAAYSF